jgi:AraC family transcriptional regulator
MSSPEVRITHLEPMRVISLLGFGSEPENQAWDKMIAWAKEKQFWQDGQAKRFFGFNNPSPTPGSPNYGYEIWMTVGPHVQPDGEARVVEFAGGLYAVMYCPVTNPWEDIPAAWQALVQWVEHSAYRQAEHQWLEEHLDAENMHEGSNFQLDLYLPIAG